MKDPRNISIYHHDRFREMTTETQEWNAPTTIAWKCTSLEYFLINESKIKTAIEIQYRSKRVEGVQTYRASDSIPLYDMRAQK